MHQEPGGLPLRSPELLGRTDSVLLIVDVQDKLLQLVDGHTRIQWNIERLLDGASLLSVPISVTEQNPEKLGRTTSSLSSRFEKTRGIGKCPVVPTSKMTFSCCGEGDLTTPWVASGIQKVVVVGIETHVCVLQTVLDLLARGFRPYVVADAVSSRSPFDREIAFRRMESAGATLVTTESVLFEWCNRAGTDEFRKLSALVRSVPPICPT